MAVTSNTFTGDGSTTNYSFTFEYLEQDEVKVTLDGTATTAFTFANATTLSFTSAPANNVEIRIYRDTDTDTLKATFFPGSAVKAEDLNDNFTQNNFAVQEIKNSTWDTDTETIKSNETWVSSDSQIATTAAMDARFQDEATETIESTETWVSDDDRVPTTLATDNRVDAKIDTAIEGDILIDSTGLTKAASNGQVTLGIGAGSVDLDRIKDADIVTSSEANPNNDSTIATTAKIDNMIDDAITGDVLIDNTGLTKVTSNGQTTLGIGAGSVDLDRIKDNDIITYAEQNAGSLTPADTNIFTASAAARRFDTLVQTGTPSGSDWEVGKTWLQNDDDQTLSVWNGSAWLGVTSGGAFRTQDKVIYVDASGGDDSKSGHRISGPKLTIKGAIADINADIDTSIKTAGSGYTDGTYNSVPITGGTTGSGLQANITVSGGAVTACTVTSASTLEEYQIGDILSADDANLGGGGGSGFELEVTGGGDGMTVIVSAGVYQEAAPIQIKRRNVSIIGTALRSTIVHPTVATEKPSNPGNSALFELNSGSFLQNLTLTGMQASNSGTNTIDSALPDKQGWNFAFYNNAYITKSPYIQNCTNFSDSEIDNSDLRAHRPRGGSGGDTDSAPTGGGMLIDGSVPKTTSPLRSMVADSYTHVGLNGPGILVTNNGYCQATSSYAFFNKYHIKTLNGGQANLAASTTDFGDEALVADGKSTTAIFTSNVDGTPADGDTTFNINEPTAGASWHGTANRPGSNMLVTVNGITYPVLSATAYTDSEGGSGWTVTISRPDPNLRSNNLGLNGAVSDDAAVSFFLRSMIASSGHTMEYVGSGTDYRALPENGGVPDDTKQIVESNDGKVWTAITDHNGKFKIGDFFEVDQRKGFINFSAGSYAFDVVTDTTPELGGQLDALTNKIVNLGTPSSSTDAATKGYVDGLSFANYTDTTANFTGTLQNGGSNVVVDSDIGSTVQAYDADTTKNDVANTFVPAQTFTAQSVHNGGIDVTGDATISDKIVHSGDTNTAIRFPAADTFAVETGGSERIRVTSTGAVAVGGASNYGTSGQVLTSNGNGAPTWQDAGGGGGEYDFVASGTISNGDTVVINSNGTVSTISGSGSITQTTGTSAVFESDNTINISATYDSANQKVVIAYRDVGNSNFGTAVVGTVSGDTISFGTPVVFESASTDNISATFDSSNNKVVIAYRDVGDSFYGTAIVGTVSGTSISFGTPVVFETANAFSSSAVYDSANGKVVIAYRDFGNSSYGTAIVGTVSGTSISFGTPTVFESASTDNISATFDSSNNKVVIAYRDDGNYSYGTAIVGTVSGTSISFGTAVVFNTFSSTSITSIFDSTNNKVVIAYSDAGNSNYGTAIVGTVSGTSISFETPIVFSAVSNTSYISMTYDSSNDRIAIFHEKGSNLVIIDGRVEGTNIVFNSNPINLNGSTGSVSATFDSSNSKVVFAYRDTGNSSYGTAIVYTPSTFSSNLNSENYIGIAAEAISNGATGKINIVGGINEGQSGLTVGKRYYVNPANGNLDLEPYVSATTPGVPIVVAGTSISSTKILVR